jgi:hypothetical protein
MIAVFDFSLAGVIYGLKGGEQDWRGPCTTEFVDTSPDRGDVTFLNRFPAELVVRRLTDGALNQTMLVVGLDEQVAAWRAEGYPCASDAYVLKHWKNNDGAAFLGIMVALEERNFAHYQRFMETHIGRPDLWGRIICAFQGFSENDYELPDTPTKDQFLDGHHYFGVGDHNIVFGTKLP